MPKTPSVALPLSLPALLPALLALSLSDAQAQSIVVPPTYANSAGDRHENVPFFYTPYVRHQQIIDQTLVPLGILSGHAYRPRAVTYTPSFRDGGWSELRVILADSTVALGQLTGNYDANLANNKVEVFKGKITMPAHNPQNPLEFSVTIPYQNPFIYLGANPLIVDLYPQGLGYEGAAGCPNTTSANGPGLDAVGDKTMQRMIGKATPCGNWPTTAGKFDIADGGYIMKFFTASVLMPYGKACADTAKNVPLLEGSGTTTIGNGAFALKVSNTPANSNLAVLLVGLSRLTGGPGPLPVDLGFAGAAGCWQNTSPDLIQFVSYNGSINLPAPIPNDPKLKGLDVFAQFAVDDPLGIFATTQGGLMHFQ